MADGRGRRVVHLSPCVRDMIIIGDGSKYLPHNAVCEGLVGIMDEADQRVYLFNFHDDISRILNFRNRSIFNYHLPRSFEYHCFHAVALSISV